MGVALLVSRARLTALAASAALVGAVLLAAPATAAPVSPSSPVSSSPVSSSPVSSSAAQSSTTTTRRPAATAPPPPTDYGPPCTAHTGAQNPVICLPEGLGEEAPASLTPGGSVEFAAQIVNNGADVSHANVVITLPAGLQLESDDGAPVYRVDGWFDDNDKGGYTDLACQAGPSTITCDVGALPRHANILVVVDLQVAADAQPGARTFDVALEPVGLPTYTSTSVSATIDVLAPSHLEVSLTPATLRTIVGHRATMTGIVHNAGTGAAPDTVAVAIAVDLKHPKRTHFSITNGTELTGPTDGGSSGSAAPVPVAGLGATTVIIVGDSSESPLRAKLQRQALARHSVQRHALPSFGFWPLGTIAPGATKRVPIKLKALRVGTDALAFGALSESDQSDCTSDESGSGSESSAASATPLDRAPAAASTTSAPAACSFLVQTHITAIPVPADAALANSGTHQLDLQLGLALWALVVGSLLVWTGRRRATRHRHG